MPGGRCGVDRELAGPPQGLSSTLSSPHQPQLQDSCLSYGLESWIRFCWWQGSYSLKNKHLGSPGASERSGKALVPHLRTEGQSGPVLRPLVWGEPVARAGDPALPPWLPRRSSPVLWPQVVMKVVQLLPDGHRVKKEVDAALDTVSETMTPMHYHLREIIICTFRQVSPAQEAASVGTGWQWGPRDPQGFSGTSPPSGSGGDPCRGSTPCPGCLLGRTAGCGQG